MYAHAPCGREQTLSYYKCSWQSLFSDYPIHRGYHCNICLPQWRTMNDLIFRSLSMSEQSHSELIQRKDDRAPDALRPVEFVLDYSRYAEGSVLIKMGQDRKSVV